MIGKCKHCGADDGLHHFATNQCPAGGREAPEGKPQRWQTQTFEPVTTELDELREEVKLLAKRVKKLECKNRQDNDQTATAEAFRYYPEQ